MDRFIGLYPVECNRCHTKDISVNMRSLSIGKAVYSLCRKCSKAYGDLLPVLAVNIQNFLRNWNGD